jgi:hypothetical protein
MDLNASELDSELELEPKPKLKLKEDDSGNVVKLPLSPLPKP